MGLHDEPKALDGLDDARKAVLEWKAGASLEGFEDAIDVILETSRRPETRKSVQDAELFKAFLGLLENAQVEEAGGQQCKIKLMRCIGNIVSDNDANRNLLVDSPSSLGLVARSIRNVTGNLEEADTAVKVLYNVCNDHTPAQQAALRASLHVSLLHYIDQHPWDEEDTQLALSIDVLLDIVQQKQHIQIQEDYDPGWIASLLKLPCIDELEAERFLDAANVTIPYLADVKFQTAVLSKHQLPLAFELLETSTFITPHLEDNEGAQYEKRLIQFLADVSTLPAFSSSYTVDDDFVQVLCDRCVLTDNKTNSASIAVCACVLLANLCVSDEVAMDLPAKIKMDSLCDYICLQAYGRSRADDSPESHAEYLHAAAGLLRHLAMPLSNRQMYFGNEQCRQAAMALVQYPQSDVQCAGLRLYRQILNEEPDRLERFVHNSYLAACLRVHAETNAPDVKIEVARLQLAHFRTLTRLLLQQPDWPLLRPILDTKGVLEPLAFAVTQSAVPLAQAEGWLGLCLVARVPGGAPIVAELFAQDGMLEALQQEVKGHAEEEIEGKVAESEAPMFTGRRNSVPGWLQEKERHNAVVLVHDLLKSSEVQEPLRGKLEAVLRDAGIRIM